MNSRSTPPFKLRAIIKLAESGNPLAQFRLGEIYADCWDVHEDVEQSIIWYRKAAEQGLGPAYMRLGSLLHTASISQAGIAIEAVKWLKKAALQHCEMAAFWLSDMYFVALPYRVKRRLEFDLSTPTHWQVEIPQSELDSLIWLDVCMDTPHSQLKYSDSVKQIREELISRLTPDEVIEVHDRVAEIFEDMYRQKPEALVIDDPVSAEIMQRLNEEMSVKIFTGDEWDQMIERLSR